MQSGSSPSASGGWVDAGHAGTAVTKAITDLVNGTAYRVRVRARNAGVAGDWVFGAGTPRSDDATLSGLKAAVAPAADGTFEALDIGTFAAGTTSYAATVASAVTHVKLTPTANEPNATVTVDSAAVDRGNSSAAIALDEGENAIDVVVTAHDGKTAKTYTVTVTRQSGDATLGALTGATSTDGSTFGGTLTLDPAFSSSGTSYAATVPNAVTHVQLTPTVTAAGKATVTVEGSAVTSATASGAIALDVGANAISVVVTAEDGTATQTYTVTVTRQSGDATLSALTGSTSTDGYTFGGTLDIGTFSATTTSYAAEVANAVTHVKLTPTASQSGAKVTVEGTAVGSGTASDAIALELGDNAISVAVTAEDVTATRTYTVTVTRLPEAPGSPTALEVEAGNGKLDLTWQAPEAGGAVSGYDVHYTSAPATGNGAVADDAAVQSGAASAGWVAASRTETDPPTASQAIASLANGTAYRVRVRAVNAGGESAWATGAGTPKSDDATLSGLTASSGASADGTFSALTLEPAFDADTTSYAATVEMSVTHAKLTPTASDGGATVQAGKGTDLAAVTSGQASGAIALGGGLNAIIVVVTAEDGKATRTYTVNITKRTPEPTSLTLTTSATNDAVAENGGPVTVTATLDYPAGTGGVEVRLEAASESTAAAADDYALPPRLTIAEGRTSATADVRIINDDIDEDDESLVLTATVGSLQVTDVTVTITDDDTAGVSVDRRSLSVGLGSAYTAEYFVSLDSEPSANVTVTPASSNTGKATVSSALVFTPADWFSPQPVTVTGVATGKATVTHRVTASTDDRYPAGLAIDSVAVTVWPGICDRTKQVRDALIQETFQDACGGVTGSHLAEVTYLYISGSELTALKAGDFDGLAALEFLTVNDTGLMSLPALGDLDSLQTLDVAYNKLTSLPDLRDLGSLDSLRASGNQLTSLPDLSSNSALATLEVDDNRLTSLPDLSGNTQLSFLNLFNNPLSNLGALTLTGSDGNAIRLNTAFAGATTEYTAEAAPGVVSVTLTPTAADTGLLPASIADQYPAPTIRAGPTGGELRPVASGSPSRKIALAAARNPIEVLVEGRDGGLKTYTVTVSASTKTYTLASAVTAAEGSDAELTVTLGEAAPTGGLELSVAYGYSGASTATADDTGTTQATVTVAEGETTATLTVPIAADDLVEGDETFTVTLSTAVSGWYAAASGVVATVTIEDEDDDNPSVAFGNDAPETTSYAATVAEDVSGGAFNVPVTVSHLPASPVTFGIEVTGGTATEGTDYAIATKSVTFGPTGGRTKNLAVAITDDADLEPDETIELAFVAAANPATGLGDFYLRGSVATLTIANDEPPPAPTDLRVTPSNAKLDLLWTAPVDPSGTLTGYDVHFTSANAEVAPADSGTTGSDPAAGWVSVSRTGKAVTQEIADLDNGSVYRLRVRATNPGGGSAWLAGTGTPAASAVASLSALTGATSTDGSDFSGTLALAPDFAASTTAYTAEVANSVTHATLIPTVTDTGKATVSVAGNAVTSGQASAAVALNVGDNAIAVVVTAEDGTTTQTYTVTVTRVSSDARLSGLAVSGASAADGTYTALTLSPDFSPGTTVYSIEVAGAVTHVRLTPTVSQSNATVSVGRVLGSATEVASGSESGAIALSVGENWIQAAVTAQDGETTRRYLVNVTRKSSDATLRGLTATKAERAAGPYAALSLLPEFSSSVTSYAAEVPHAVTHVRLVPTGGHRTAELVVRKGTERVIPSFGDDYQVELSVGTNEIELELTAADESSIRTYTVTVTRLPAPPGSPKDLDVEAGDGKLDLTWTAPETGGDPAGYEVHYTSSATVADGAEHLSGDAPSAADGWIDAEHSGTSVSLEIAGLVDGTEYRIRVRARNAGGTSGWLTGAGTPRAPPGVPTALQVEPGNGRLDLTWTAPVSGGAVSGYEVHYTSAPEEGEGAVASDAPVQAGQAPSASAGWVAVSPTGTAVTQAIAGLDNGTAYRLRVRATNDGGESAWLTGTGTPALPAATIAAGTSPVTEGTAASFTVKLSSAAPSGGLTVNLTVADASGSDFVAAADEGAKTLAFAAGDTSKTYEVATVADVVDEDNADVTVTVASGTGYTVGTPSSAKVTVNDDDDAPQGAIGLSLNPTSAGESADATTVTVTATLPGTTARSEATALTVKIGKSGDAATEGTDYGQVDDVTLTIPAGSRTGTATFSIDPAQDTLDEGTGEALTVHGTTSVTGFTVGEATFTITDDDAPAATIAAGTSPVTEGTAASFTVKLSSAAPSGGLTVNLTVADASGSDFVAAADEGAKTLAFAAGDTSKTYEVATVADTTDEATGDVTVTLASGDGYTIASPAPSASVTVNDDDAPAATIAAGTSPVTEGTAASFTVTLSSAAPEGGLTVALTVADGGEVVAAADEGAKTLAFAAGDTSKTYEVATVADVVDEDNADVTVTVASGTGYTVGTPSSAKVTVNDDDDAPQGAIGLSLNPTSAGESADATTVTVTATLPGTTARSEATALTVKIGKSGDAATEGTDYGQVDDVTLTIPAGSRTGTATFSIDPAQDTLDEGTGEALTVHGTTSVTGFTVGEATFTITDDDAPAATIAAGTSPVTEGTAASFTVKLSSAALLGAQVTVNDDDFVAAADEGAKTLAFAAGDTSKTYEVATVADTAGPRASHARRTPSTTTTRPRPRSRPTVQRGAGGRAHVVAAADEGAKTLAFAAGDTSKSRRRACRARRPGARPPRSPSRSASRATRRRRARTTARLTTSPSPSPPGPGPGRRRSPSTRRRTPSTRARARR